MVGERYRIFNVLSEEHGKYLTIIKVDNDQIYYLFDGCDDVQCFSIGSEMEVDLIKLV